MNDKKNNLIWIDLEFSGIDFKTNQILEIAVMITDYNLNILTIGPNLAIKTNPEILNNMDKWNTKHHNKTGLIEKCLKSSITMQKAESEVLSFLKKWTLAETSPLCGNSVGQDKRMLYKNMPELESYFHYRIIDVSTIKELSKKWYPNLPKFKKENTHNALNDIQESIEELKYYKKNIFIIDLPENN